MVFPLLVLVLFTLFVGFLGIPFNRERTDLGLSTTQPSLRKTIFILFL